MTRGPKPGDAPSSARASCRGTSWWFGDSIRLEQDYGAYIYAISGSVGVGDTVLAEGDVATVTDTADLKIFGDGPAHAMIVVVPLKDYEVQ